MFVRVTGIAFCTHINIKVSNYRDFWPFSFIKKKKPSRKFFVQNMFSSFKLSLHVVDMSSSYWPGSCQLFSISMEQYSWYSFILFFIWDSLFLYILYISVCFCLDCAFTCRLLSSRQLGYLDNLAKCGSKSGYVLESRVIWRFMLWFKTFVRMTDEQRHNRIVCD